MKIHFMKLIQSHLKTYSLIFLILFSTSDSISAVKLDQLQLNKANRDISKTLKKSQISLPKGFNMEKDELANLSSSANQFSLLDSLKFAIINNPGIQSNRDELNTLILRYHQTLDSYSPQLKSSLSYIISDSKNSSKETSHQQNFGITQKTGLGGRVNLDFSSAIKPENNTQHSSQIDLQVNQPLLKGFGRFISRENAISDKRSLLYEFRDFKNQIDRFAINIIQQYTNIVNQEIKNENFKRQFLKDQWLYKRTLAFFNIGRVSKLELLRVNQRKHNSENAWKNRIESWKNSIESFKLLMNFNSEGHLSLKPFAVVYKPLEANGLEQIVIALSNRLDYETSKDILEDAKRQYKIAKNGLLPELSLNAKAGIRTDKTSNKWLDQDLNKHRYSSTLSLNIPLNKIADRIEIFEAQNTIQRRERNHKLLKSTISIEVRNRIRSIKQLEKSIEIQNLILASEEKRYGVAQYRFQTGEVSNREVIEASESLTIAENAKLDLYLEHFIERLNLENDMGTLSLDYLFNLLKAS